MTKEMAKAIRLVNGYNTDLRIKLNHPAYLEKVENFIIDHLFDLYGVSIVDSIGVSIYFKNKPEEYMKVLQFAASESAFVCC